MIDKHSKSFDNPTDEKDGIFSLAFAWLAALSVSIATLAYLS